MHRWNATIADALFNCRKALPKLLNSLALGIERGPGKGVRGVLFSRLHSLLGVGVDAQVAVLGGRAHAQRFPEVGFDEEVIGQLLRDFVDVLPRGPLRRLRHMESQGAAQRAANTDGVMSRLLDTWAQLNLQSVGSIDESLVAAVFDLQEALNRVELVN